MNPFILQQFAPPKQVALSAQKKQKFHFMHFKILSARSMQFVITEPKLILNAEKGHFFSRIPRSVLRSPITTAPTSQKITQWYYHPLHPHHKARVIFQNISSDLMQ